MIWRVYQSVLSSDVFATTTSRRMPSTSWAYQSGKVSLSPTVTSTPYGSTEFSKSAATSRVAWWLPRDATVQLPMSGTATTNSIGEADNQLRRVGSTAAVRPVRTSREPNNPASDSHTY